MFLLINLSLLEIAVLLAGAVVLGIAIYFFIVSQRSLKLTMQKTNEKITLRPGFYGPSPVTKSHKSLEPAIEEVKEIKRTYPIEPERPVAVKPRPVQKEESIETLKETVLQQQKLLNSFLRQVEEIESEGREELEMQNKHLQNEIKSL